MTSKEEVFGQNILGKVRKSNRRNKVLLSVLQYDWPTTEVAIQKMGNYISDQTKLNPAESENIAYEAVRFALSEYSEVLYTKNAIKNDDPLRYSAFINALITKVLISMGNKNNNSSEREKLYSLVTTVQMRDILKRVNHEQAIITNTLDFNN